MNKQDWRIFDYMVIIFFALFMAYFTLNVANANTFFKGINNSYLVEEPTSTASAGGTTTLTATSNTVQIFTGVTTQTVVLPNATTLPVGRSFYIGSQTTGALTIQDASAGTLTTILALESATFRLITNGSAAGSWDVEFHFYGGGTGILPLSQGGTGTALANGSANQIIQSNGNGTVKWSTATFPSTATTTGTILRADGTNWAASTLTVPNTATAPCAMVVNTNDTQTCLAATTTNRLMRTNGTTIAFSQADLTTDVTGILPVANGGTGASSLTNHGVLIGQATSAVVATAAGSAGQVLQSGGAAADPSYSTATYPSTAGTVPAALVANTANTYTNVVGTTANRLLRTDGSTISFAQAALTTDVTGVLPVANGGSGTSTQFTTGSVVFAGGSGVYSQDNTNFFWDDTNNFLGIGVATPATALHVDAPDGATNRLIQLTNADTGVATTDGITFSIDSNEHFEIRNLETSKNMTLQSDTGVLQIFGAGGAKVGAGSMTVGGIFDVESTAGFLYPPRMTTTERNAVASGSPDNGAILYNSTTNKINFRENSAWTSVATLPISLTADVTGVLPLANGGTNKNMTAVAGGAVYTDADSQEVTSAGTSGQVLTSAGTGAPAFGWGSQVAAMMTFATVETVSTTSTSATFATGSNWTGPTEVYDNANLCDLQNTDNNGPRITCSAAKAGIYTISWNTIWSRNNTNDIFARIYCSDGTTTYDFAQVRSTGSIIIFSVDVQCTFYYSSAASRTWDVRISSENGAATTDLAFISNKPVVVRYSPIP